MNLIVKPLIFFLTFILTIINFIILLVPVAIIAFPVWMFIESLFVKVGDGIIYFLVSRISFLMLAYMLLDMILGFTVRRLNKNSIPIKKAQSLHGHEEIEATFEWVKNKYKMRNVELMINQSFAEVNAYAIGSLRKKTVTLTMGLLAHLRESSNSESQYIDAVRGIIGHEMSHLANGDYLPGLLTSANQVANNQISGLIRWFFIILANVLRIIPFVGDTLYQITVGAYNLINIVINLFLKWVFLPIFDFLKLWLGRSIEYRCDRDSAHAFGGRKIATALSMLGKDGYLSVFSTHPRTKSRINYVEDIRPEGGAIRPSIITILSNYISIGLVIAVFAYSTYKTDVPGMYRHYMDEVHYPLVIKYERAKQGVMGLYYKVKN